MTIKTKHIDSETVKTLITPNIQKMYNMFKFFGYELRFVGGSVRDLLLKKKPRDLDFATDADPYEMIYIFNELTKKKEAVATYGIMHGTVVITFNDDEVYEVTSINFSMHIADHRISVSKRRDWRQDAGRRDFTVNAMSMNFDGKIYDYASGLEDIKNQNVTFLGDYENKIKADPVMILRFFKLLGKFKDPNYKEEYVTYIKEHKSLLSGLKKETVTWFRDDIKSQPYADNSLKAMKKAGVYNTVFLENILSMKKSSKVTNYLETIDNAIINLPPEGVMTTEAPKRVMLQNHLWEIIEKDSVAYIVFNAFYFKTKLKEMGIIIRHGIINVEQQTNTIYFNIDDLAGQLTIKQFNYVENLLKHQAINKVLIELSSGKFSIIINKKYVIGGITNR